MDVDVKRLIEEDLEYEASRQRMIEQHCRAWGICEEDDDDEEDDEDIEEDQYTPDELYGEF